MHSSTTKEGETQDQDITFCIKLQYFEDQFFLHTRIKKLLSSITSANKQMQSKKNESFKMVDVLLKLKQSLTHHLCELEEEVFDLRCETNILKDTIDSSFQNVILMNSYEKLSLELNEKIMAREELVQKGEAIKKGLKNKERQNVNAKYINFKSEAQKAIVNEQLVARLATLKRFHRQCQLIKMIEAEATKLKKLREGKGLLIKYAVAGTPYTIYREAQSKYMHKKSKSMDAFLHGSSPQEQLLERELQVYGVNKKVMLLKIGKQLQLQRHKLLEKSVDQLQQKNQQLKIMNSQLTEALKQREKEAVRSFLDKKDSVQMTREEAIMKLLIEQDKMDRYYSLMVSSSLVSWFEKGRERFCQTVTNNSREAKIMEYPSTQVNRRHQVKKNRSLYESVQKVKSPKMIPLQKENKEKEQAILKTADQSDPKTVSSLQQNQWN